MSRRLQGGRGERLHHAQVHHSARERHPGGLHHLQGHCGGEMTEPLGMEPLGKAVEMLEIICMKPFGMKVIGMAPLRMELAKLRTAAELLER